MLAYVFWHRPRRDVDPTDYEEGQRVFQAALGAQAASFRLAELPFEGGPGYEDWYLAEDWRALGELNEAAVDSVRRASHDHAATMSGEGWGSIYGLAKGTAAIPDGIAWLEKPRGEASGAFVESLPNETIWRRQMALGPGPEFCAVAAALPARVRIWP
jgi:hypothetical protein